MLLHQLMLPPEVVDLVIDQLCEDKHALRACSLTHSSWLRRAHHHLFRRVCLNQGPRGAQFRELLDGSPHLGRHIHEVELCGTTLQQTLLGVSDIRWPTLNQRGDDTGRPIPAPEHWLECVLPQSADVLSRVTSLRMINLSITPELVNALEKHFASVTTVIVDACRAASFKEFCELPRALRLVQQLYLLDAHWLRVAGGPSPSEQLLHSPSLKTLVLSAKVESATVVNWLVAERRFMALTSLFCDMSGGPSALAVRHLLHALGASLKYLGIGFSAVRDATEVLNAGGLSLEPCTGLQRVDLLCSSDARAASLSWTILLLSKVASPHLRKVVFLIPAANVGALNLEVLRVVLSHARYASLRRLVFQIEVRAGKSSVVAKDVEERLRTRLAGLVERGVELRIAYQPPTTPLCPPRRVA